MNKVANGPGCIQVSPDDLEDNVSALSAMAGQDISYEDWRTILSKEVIGDKELVTDLHDYLLDHGDEIQTAEELLALVQRLKMVLTSE